MNTLDTVIIGGGAMGSAAAWALARRGRSVTLLEQFAPGHTNGASHGTTRNFNPGYSESHFVALLASSVALWRRLGEEAGIDPITRTGVVNFGDPIGQEAIARALSVVGIGAEHLGAEAARERWRGINFAGPVLHLPDGGQLNPDEALPAFQRVAAEAGAEIRHGVRVCDLRIVDDGLAEISIETAAGSETIRARTVVCTAGAWTRALLEPALEGRATLPRLVVTQEQPLHFAVADEGAIWPGFNHSIVPGTPGFEGAYSSVYGMFTPGAGVKVGWHGTGEIVDPDRRSFAPEPRQLRALADYARQWLPGVDADVFTEISCTYTSTEDENFILDRIGPIVIGAGFSGQGFKFTPAVGQILADLADGSGSAPAAFSAGRRIRSRTFAHARSLMPEHRRLRASEAPRGPESR